jgi:small subunit ribosomal protein S1
MRVVEMTNTSLDNPIPIEPDESYWAALFQQEESTLLPPLRPEVDGVWSGLSERLDGRFHWSDGDRPGSEDPWETAEEFFAADQTLQLIVTSCNKGGLIVHWNGLQGFVPASQLVDFPHFHLELERTRALKRWLNKVLKLKIIEVNPAKNRLILSERAALVKADERESLLHQIQRGDKVKGVVTNLTDFGVFVDLGGVEGLIHISELSWSRVTHPSHVLQPDQEVAVVVLSVDRENARVALSIKRLKPDPWQSVEKRYRPGQLVTGVVSNIVNYGAFVVLEEELEGLIHISELAEGTFFHPRNVVQKGDKVTARVLAVDGQAKRLALSLRGIQT